MVGVVVVVGVGVAVVVVVVVGAGGVGVAVVVVWGWIAGAVGIGDGGVNDGVDLCCNACVHSVRSTSPQERAEIKRKIMSSKKNNVSKLAALTGQRVLLMCMNYFYVGKIVSVEGAVVSLEDASIVYETGEWTAATWRDAQKLNRVCHVRVRAIESFMLEPKL